MTHAMTSARFLPTARGKRFLVLQDPAVRPAEAVLWVPPFGEEMNRCRRMMAEAGRALAEAGFASALLDLGGTGDSEGEIADFTLDDWLGDLSDLVDHLQDQQLPVRHLVGVRFGANLALRLLRSGVVRPTRAAYWQPFLDGRTMLTQLLRVRATATAMSADGKETATELLARLEGGEIIEVAGYAISTAMARSIIDSSVGTDDFASSGDVRWIDLGRTEDRAPPKGAAQALGAVKDAGKTADLTTLLGDPYWGSVEVLCDRAVIGKTVDWIVHGR